MADKPILFSAPMVRALLDGRKTQTRRIIKKPAALNALAVFGANFLTLRGNIDLIGYAPGDRLWVKERVAWVSAWGWRFMADNDDLAEKRESGEVGKWCSPIHMPRWASRLTLTVTDVRVQRLQDISEADAWAEGCKCGDPWDNGLGHFPAEEPSPDGHGWVGWDDAKEWFADLWISINGPDAWDANPWVVAVSFAVHRCNIDKMEAANG